MAVYIQAMDVPDDCCTCLLRHRDGESGYCPFTESECPVTGRQDACPIVHVVQRVELKPGEIHVDAGLFDREEIYPDCTVQVLSNSLTGETSIGWWKNE